MSCSGPDPECQDCHGRDEMTFEGCPSRPSGDIRRAIELFHLFRSSSQLPASGGLLQQTPAFLSVIRILENDVQALQEQQRRGKS